MHEKSFAPPLAKPEMTPLIVCALYPNTTHILQPLDVAVFGPLKCRWKKICRKWRLENNFEEITKYNNCNVLQKIIYDGSIDASIKSGFQACGLYPFNAGNMDYTKCIIPNAKAQGVQHQQKPPSYLEHLESKIEPQLLASFKETKEKAMDWQGDYSASMLFDIWVQFVEESERSNIPIPENSTYEESGCDQPPSLEAANFIAPSSPSIVKSEPSTSQTLIASHHSPSSAALSNTPKSSNVENSNHDDQGIITSPSLNRSMEEVLQSVLYWPDDKVKVSSLRKRKCVPVPSVITSEIGREYLKSKENAKIKRKKSEKSKKVKDDNDDWNCNVCQASWMSEDKEGISQTWIQCDQCKKPYHFTCIPKSYINKFELTIPNSDDEEYLFLCMECTNKDQDSDK